MWKVLRAFFLLAVFMVICVQVVSISEARAATISPSVKVKMLPYKNGIATYPIVSGLANGAVQEKINRFILNEIQNTMQKAKTAVTAHLVTSVVYNQNDLLCFLVQCDEYYEGTAHGLTTLKGYTFDTTSGKLCQMRDLYNIDGPNRECLNSQIARQIAEKQLLIFEPFTGITANPEFYLVPDYIVIIFQPYEIAPYSTGILEFALPAKGH